MDVELPSRNAFPSCRHQWLKEKAAMDRLRAGEGDDDVQHLWIHRGKLYDLRPYVETHPGGRDFLLLTQGMDVTALVESHHLNQPLVQQVLSKYYVRHTQAAAQAAGKGKGKGKGAEAVEDFSWAEGGFIRTVQRRTLALLGETRAARGPSMEMRVIVWLTLLAWAVAFGAMCVVRASTWLPALVAGFFLYGLLGIGHNGMHTAHPWRYLMDLSLFSHAEWTVSHCLSHHHWPNTQVDFEISAIEPFIWSLASKAGHKHRYLPLYLWGVLCILGPFELVGRVSNIAKGLQPLRSENLLPVLQLALVVWGQGDWHVGSRRWLLMHVVSSVLMGLQALPLHHSDFSWTDGKLAPRPIDFGAHVLLTTQDYAVSGLSLAAKVLLVPFNHHRLHHLLPAVDESRLPELEPMLQQTCVEFGHPYRLYTFRELAAGTLRNWLDLSPAAPIEGGGDPTKAAAKIMKK